MNIDDVKVSANDLKTTSKESNTKSNKKTKNNLKGGSVHDNIEINEKCLDEIVHNNHL